jgi:hypothetical protein
VQNGVAHTDVSKRRQLLGVEPCDVEVFLGCKVCRRSLPVADQPSAEECLTVWRASGDATELRRRACSHLHAELLPQLSRKCVQLGLSWLDDPARQVPDARMRVLVGTSVPQEDSTAYDERAEDDFNHSRIKPVTVDATAFGPSRACPALPPSALSR